jgi:hypothetical protein
MRKLLIWLLIIENSLLIVFGIVSTKDSFKFERECSGTSVSLENVEKYAQLALEKDSLFIKDFSLKDKHYVDTGNEFSIELNYSNGVMVLVNGCGQGRVYRESPIDSK